ncbi:MAG: ketopantoate reductase family protein [Oscillospiraceae bacterium]
MKILVYGAGVIGCEMAHILCRAKQQVTLLARGAWGETLQKNGLIIRHYAQMHTTTDHIPVIEALAPGDVYDLIFVVMQHGQLPQVLPVVAQNHSRHVVLVGNNMNAEQAARTLAASPVEKEVAFGFQGTGGRRENGKVISVHAGVGMTVGGLRAPLSAPFASLLKEAFAGTRYRLTQEENMDAWLKCHMAFILPIAYVCYATNFHLPKATGHQLDMAMEAALEGYAVLKKLGYPIRPANSEEAFGPGRKKTKALLWGMAKTPLGRLAASDHCKNAGAEMLALDKAFTALNQQAGIATPAWNALRAEGAPRI